MTSILTNNSAAVALQTLKSINKGMNKVQNEISTGMKVATAKDNSASWAIASTMKSDSGALKTLSESLTSASALVGVARSATEQTGDLLRQIQEKVVQAQNPDADATTVTKLTAEVTALAGTITSIAGSAQYNGINLVNTGSTAEDITVSITRAADGTVGSQTFSSGVADLAAVATAITGIADISAAGALDIVDTQLDTVNTAAATFGAAQARIEAQSDFLNKQAASLKEGVGALVDADMEEASARLQALQVQQQLGTQALSIANQAPQNVLSLFR
jgi:flagellin